MNLTPFYEVKERLEHAGIAGALLIEEDFRLRRAVDGLAPLASASPVFAKIKAGADALFTAPAEERGGKLLDVLSLVDAVAYTQGVTGIQGQLSPLPQGTGTYVTASYAQLQPLITALTGTGSGRMTVIQNVWENHPSFFADFRVLPHVVTALGNNYSELADLAEEILTAQGADIIPLLKKDFAPDGKKDMVRRVRIIIRLAGAAENEWYKTVLPDSTKTVREALITALSYSPDNTQLLLDLCRSERGNLKNQAQASLACMDSPEAREFWEKEQKKHPQSVWKLTGLHSAHAADITARALRAQIEVLLQTDSTPEISYEDLCNVICAAYGKYSDDMRDCWRWLGSQMDSLDNTAYEKPRYAALTLTEQLEKCLLLTVMWNPCEETFALAREMFTPDSHRFIGAVFAADLLSLSAEEVYEKYCIYFDPARNQEQAAYRTRLMMVWQNLRRRNDSFVLAILQRDILTGTDEFRYLAIATPDPRWADCLTHPKLAKHYETGSTSPVWHKKDKLYWDDVMRHLIDPHSPEVCQTISEYLYHLLWQTGQLHRYFRWLMECGWTKWEGVFVHCVQVEQWVEWYWLKDMLQAIPVSGKVKAKELRQIDELVKEKKTKVGYGRWHNEEIAQFIAQWEAEPELPADEGKETNA